MPYPDTELTPLPGDYLYPGKDEESKKAREVYDALKDVEKIKNGGKWWSMYDLMKFFHSGFIPEEGDNNYITFKLDLTSPTLKWNSVINPSLLQRINTPTNTLTQKLSTDVNNLIAAMKVQTTTQVATAASGPRGAQLFATQPVGGKRNKKNKMRGGAPEDEIKQLVSADNLKSFILEGISNIEFTARDPVFLTTIKKGNLLKADAITSIGENINTIKNAVAAISPAAAEPLAAPAPAPAAVPPAAGGQGKKYKTRKARKNKKSKTHRRRK